MMISPQKTLNFLSVINPDSYESSTISRDFEDFEFRWPDLRKELIKTSFANPAYKNNPIRPLNNKMVHLPAYKDKIFSASNFKRMIYQILFLQADMHEIENARKTLDKKFHQITSVTINTSTDFIKSFDCPFEVPQLEKKIFFDDLETLDQDQLLEEMQDFSVIKGRAYSCYRTWNSFENLFLESGNLIAYFHPFIAFKVIEAENTNPLDKNFLKLIYFVYIEKRWFQWNSKQLQPQLVRDWTTPLFNDDGEISKEGGAVFKLLSNLVQNKEILDLQGKKFQLYHSSSAFMKNARKI